MGSGILLAASGTFVMVALVVGAATSWWLSRIAPERRRLAHAKAESGSGVLVKNRLLTDGNQHRTFFTALPKFAPNTVAMFAMLDKNRAGLLVVHRDPIGADIDESGIGVFLNNAHPGADIAADVFLMPLGRGKFKQIDLPAA